MENNNRDIIIALDAMGGDYGASVVIKAASLATKELENIKFLFFGDQTKIEEAIKGSFLTKDLYEIIHTSSVISSNDRPTTALRRGKDSSMWKAIQSVKDGIAHSIVSAGNTGALMVISRFAFGTLEDIDRPAIVTLIPSMNQQITFLDMGANTICDSNNLLQFAIMGNAFSKTNANIKNPQIGLLNVGSEEIKGNAVIQYAHQLIQECENNLNYIGYIEGNDILFNPALDVVVTDGFTGNIALKAIEGTSRFIKHQLTAGFKSSIMSKLGYHLSKKSLAKRMNLVDPRNSNGAMLIGLNGICVKSHGNADAKAFKHSIKIAYNLSKNDINSKILEELKSTPSKI